MMGKEILKQSKAIFIDAFVYETCYMKTFYF
jgi:hypothetical protein